MCKILNRTRKKVFTGLKVAHKIGNRYYSPATGVEYKVGPVTPATKIIRSKTSSHWSSQILNKDGNFFCKEMYGKTSVFKSLEDLTSIIHVLLQTEVILKMTISGGIWKAEMATGRYSSIPLRVNTVASLKVNTAASFKMNSQFIETFAGTEILSMKETDLRI